MYTNLDEIVLKPNMVINFFDKDKNIYYRITFIKYLEDDGVFSDAGILAVYDGIKDVRKVKVTGETVTQFCNGDFLPLNQIDSILDYNLPLDKSLIYKRIEMTVSEIEKKLGLYPGTLNIKK